MLARIIEIKKVEPYKVICLFSNNEVREIDFDKWLNLSEQNSDSSYFQLGNKNIFMQVRIDQESQTLCWDGLMRGRDYDGSEIIVPLDFCPDVLFEISKPISQEKNYH